MVFCKSIAPVVLFFSLFVLDAGSVFSQCYYSDSPECGCFDNTGVWNPSGSILNIATATVGTKESCESNGGKPFYQIQLGINSKSNAQDLAHLLDIMKDFGITIYSRSAWCSETIAYWHREAGIPYSNGYKCSWHPTWKLTNTKSVRLWYKTAETKGARGRWVSGIDLDYEHFQPGVNAPCPGAYQQLEGWSSSGGWQGTSNAHSQMIQDMTVYKNASGKVTRIDVTILEGNAGDKIKNTTKYEDIFEYTRYGSKWISSDRKIRGWGIDLKSGGTPNYDASKITYVTETTSRARQVSARLTEQDNEDDAMVKALLSFASKVESSPTALGSGIEKLSLPTKTSPIQLSPNATQDSKINISLPEPFPIKVKGVYITFEGSIPNELSLEAAGASKQFSLVKKTNLKSAVDRLKSKVPTASLAIFPMYFKMQQMNLQFLALTIPKGKMTTSGKISSVDLDIDWGPEDSDKNP